MNFEERQLLGRYLLPRERLIWTGRPLQGLAFRRDDLWLVPCSLVVAAFAIEWTSTWWSKRDSSDMFFGLHGALLLAGAFYFVIGRFVHDAWLRGRTFYAITNRRLIFLQRGLLGRFRSIALGHMPLFEYEEHGGGRGTILFDFDQQQSPGWWRGWWDYHIRGLGPSRAPRFDRIEKPRQVYDLIVRETERWRDEQNGETPDPAFANWFKPPEP